MQNHTLRFTLAVVILVTLAGPAFAVEEPTASEQRFMKALVAGLTDDSPAVRAASEEALALMGGKAAWYLVDQIKRLKSGALDAAVRVLVRVGRPSLEQIELLEKRPSGKAGDALERVLSAFTGDGGVGGFGQAEPDMVARVREIMRKVPRDSWGGMEEPALVELVALGRPAIPALLPYIGPGADRTRGMAGFAAVSALGDICDSGDTVRLGLLLDQGWMRIASVMRDIGDPACIYSLVRALDEGRMSHDVGSALQHFEHPASRAPVVQFLTERGTTFPSGTSSLLELMEVLRATEALPAIRKMLATPARERFNESRQKMYTAKALARLGDPAGIPVLISLVVLPRDDQWMERWVGEALNGVTGQSFWSEGSNATQVKAAYEKWWKANGEDLTWNEAARQYEKK
jgi:PBS lyase HEAT-like repeat